MPFRPKSIDELCKKAQITQHKLAAETEKPQSTIYRWAKAISVPSIESLDSLYKVASKYKVKIDFYIEP